MYWPYITLADRFGFIFSDMVSFQWYGNCQLPLCFDPTINQYLNTGSIDYYNSPTKASIEDKATNKRNLYLMFVCYASCDTVSEKITKKQ